MKCTKCGKEIPEGENKVCEECQAKVLEEIANEEKNNSKEVKKETSKETTQNKSKNVFPVIIAVVIVAIIALMFIIGVFVFSKKGIGNTIGNVRNYGYGAVSGNWIYYLSPNEDSSNVGLYKVKKNGTDKKELFMNENNEEIVSINVFGNYIYFIQISQEDYNDEDQINNKICRIRKDGKNFEVINDNELNNDCYEIYVINGSVYYIDLDANVAKMDLDGSNKTVVAENGTGYLGITDKYIIFNDYKEESSDEYITYIMDINGQNKRTIVEGKRLYSINIDGKYIYYTNDEKAVYRTKIDSNQEELITEKTAYNLNLEGKYLYFLNYADIENEDYTVCIYRIKTDGSMKEPENIKQLEQYSSFINLVDGWILYMDGNDTSAFINMTKVDGKKEVQLYYLNYEEYYENFNEPVNPDLPQDGEDVEPPSDNTGTETPDTSTNTVGNATTPEVSNTASNTAVPENTNSVANTTNTAENVSNTTN